MSIKCLLDDRFSMPVIPHFIRSYAIIIRRVVFHSEKMRTNVCFCHCNCSVTVLSLSLLLMSILTPVSVLDKILRRMCARSYNFVVENVSCPPGIGLFCKVIAKRRTRIQFLKTNNDSRTAYRDSGFQIYCTNSSFMKQYRPIFFQLFLWCTNYN